MTKGYGQNGKFCDHKYIANSSHGTGNLQKHMKVCGGKLIKIFSKCSYLEIKEICQ
jgi:hypothetical protein